MIPNYINFQPTERKILFKSCVRLKQSLHLPVNATAQSPVPVYEEVDCCKQQHHGHRIIEET